MKTSTKSHLSLLTLIFLMGLFSPVARAQLISLGQAANFAGLEMGTGTNGFTISSGNTRITGNVGVAANGNLNDSGGAQITGTIDAGAGASVVISGGSAASGGTVQPYAQMAQAISDAGTAASFYAGLTPTQTISTLNNNTGTITVGSGVSVFDVTGSLSLSAQNLTLAGNSNSTLVFDIHGGNNSMQGTSSIILNGISADQVLFNLIGTGVQFITGGNSVTEGIFLAENGAISISGGTHVSDFIAGGSLTFQSGPTITQATTLTPVPELGTWPTALFSLALMGLMVRLRRKPAKPAPALA